MSIVKQYHEPIISNCNKNVYTPSDDTYLIIDYFKDNIDEMYFDGIKLENIKKILDLGTGTGIIALFLQMMKQSFSQFNPKIYASDILEDAIRCAKKNEQSNNIRNEIIFIQSDLFESFPISLENCFNIIIFNPPYLPSLEFNNKIGKKFKIDVTWNGGKKGIEVFARFIKQVKKFLVLNKKSYIYYVSSDKADLSELNNIIYNEGFSYTILDKKHIFFENIFLNRLEYIND
ncbi:MAG: HemK2/MTQ2 family protein methyltransferase [Candidatus Heimdallarchaeota archaeon]